MFVKLTDEDKKIFKLEAKKANPSEILIIAKFIESATLSMADKSFCRTHIGMRCERLLRNVAKNNSFTG